MASFSWTQDTLFKELNPDRIIAGAHIKMEQEAQRIQGQMQANRPWTDRTGQAKRTLSTTTARAGNSLIMTLSHGVEYGQWLELRWSGRYAIIKPTLTTQAPQVMAKMAGLLNSL
jgi:hypothetical protein